MIHHLNVRQAVKSALFHIRMKREMIYLICSKIVTQESKSGPFVNRAWTGQALFLDELFTVPALQPRFPH